MRALWLLLWATSWLPIRRCRELCGVSVPWPGREGWWYSLPLPLTTRANALAPGECPAQSCTLSAAGFTLTDGVAQTFRQMCVLSVPRFPGHRVEKVGVPASQRWCEGSVGRGPLAASD